MDYPIRLGYSREQVRKAQWDVLRAVEKGLCNYASLSTVDQQRIRELLDSFSDEMDDPIGYAEAFGQTLAQSVTCRSDTHLVCRVQIVNESLQNAFVH